MDGARIHADVVRIHDHDEARGQEGPEVIEVSADEYQRAVNRELADVGLTYNQLRRQAKSGKFSSLRARKLWLAIGEPRVAR